MLIFERVGKSREYRVNRERTVPTSPPIFYGKIRRSIAGSEVIFLPYGQRTLTAKDLERIGRVSILVHVMESNNILGYYVDERLHLSPDDPSRPVIKYRPRKKFPFKLVYPDGDFRTNLTEEELVQLLEK